MENDKTINNLWKIRMIEDYGIPTPKTDETEYEYIPRSVEILKKYFHPDQAYEICQRFWDEK